MDLCCPEDLFPCFTVSVIHFQRLGILLCPSASIVSDKSLALSFLQTKRSFTSIDVDRLIESTVAMCYGTNCLKSRAVLEFCKDH